MVELLEIPCQGSEDVIDVAVGNIRDYNPNQIDVVHRTSSTPIALIIIMFDRKRDRKTFISKK